MEESSRAEAMKTPQKRKAPSLTGSRSKKPRQEITEASDWEEISVPSSDDDGSSGDEVAASTTAPTPSTPISASHTPTSKPRPKNHHCSYPSCNKAFARPIRLEEHLRSHTNSRPYVCPEPSCGKSYLRDSHLKHHLKSAHTSIRDYVCNWSGCSKAFATGTRLERHIATHEGKEKFRCRVEGCGMTFRKHNTLQKHTKIVHEGLKPFVCTVTIPQEDSLGSIETTCYSGFDTAARLKAHQIRMHTANRFMCDMCSEADESRSKTADQSTTSSGIWFATYSLLQSHIKTFHPPICPQCSAVLPSSSALSSHIEIYHEMSLTERQSHFCPDPHCERGFTSKGNLTMHVKAVHQQKRDFVCGESDISGAKYIPEDWKNVQGCGSKFATKGNLVGHFRQVHLGDQRKGKRQGGKRSPVVSHVASPPATPSDLVRALTKRGEEMQSLACLEPFCFFTFHDSNALFVHLQNMHGIARDGVGSAELDQSNDQLFADEGAKDREREWHEWHERRMDAEDTIAERALRALQEEMQREALPIDPMLV